MDYIDLKKRTGIPHLNSGVLKALLCPIVAPMLNTNYYFNIDS
jgi:hypothetical protein